MFNKQVEVYWTQYHLKSALLCSFSQGYRVLPNTDILLTPDSQRPWFCSTRPEPASLGIGRLWVYGPSRKNGIATRLVECVR